MPELVHYSEGRLVTDGGQNIPDTASRNTGTSVAPRAKTTTGAAASLPFYNALDFGVLADWVKVTGAAMTSGSAHLIRTATFVPTDVGKVVSMSGAGAASATLYSTIASYVSADEVVLADTASSTVASGTLQYGTDNGPLIQAVLSLGGRIHLPAGDYAFATQMTLTNGCRLLGESASDVGTPGTRLHWLHAFDGTHAIVGGSAGFPLSDCQVRDLQITSATAVRPSGTGDAFHIQTFTNGSMMDNVRVSNFAGNAFAFDKLGDTVTALGNATLKQLFATSCSGYGMSVTGFCAATITMPDFNTCTAGGFYFTGGSNNQSAIVIESYWHEGQAAGSSTNAVVLDAMAGQMVVFIGGVFKGTATGDAIHIQGATSAAPCMVGCTGFGFTNWINDTVNTMAIAMSPGLNYFGGSVISAGVLAQGVNTFVEVFQTNGTTNKKRSRLINTSGLLALRSINDAGASNGDMAFWDLGTFVFKPQKSIIQMRVTQTLASNGAVTFDANAGNDTSVTLNANATSSSITNPTTGERLTIAWRQDATGGRTYVWPTSCRFVGGSAPSDTTANTATSVDFVYDGSLWIERARAVAVPIT